MFAKRVLCMCITTKLHVKNGHNNYFYLEKSIQLICFQLIQLIIGIQLITGSVGSVYVVDRVGFHLYTICLSPSCEGSAC